MLRSGTNLFTGLFIGLGTALAGYFISLTLYNSKIAVNTAEVKGLAEKRVQADLANWDIILTVSGSSKKEIPKLYEQAQENQKVVVDLLKENGILEDEIKIGVLNYNQSIFRDNNQKIVDETHRLNGVINIETSEVGKIEKVRVKLNGLIAKGLDLENLQPKYYFTKLNEVKPAMLKEATKNARLAAKEFAANAGVKVGNIRSARQGNFYVKDIGSEYTDSDKIEKNVRVVTTITFYLN